MSSRDRARAEQAAADDVQRATTRILDRLAGQARELASLEIHQAYVGRYHLTPRAGLPERCAKHPNTTPQAGGCPVCGPVPDGEDL